MLKLRLLRRGTALLVLTTPSSEEGLVGVDKDPCRCGECLAGRAEQQTTGKAEMWFAGFQPQHHKSKYRKMGLELRDNNLTTGTETSLKRKLMPTPIING